MSTYSDVRDIPWVEKYRPKSLKDVVSQTLTIQSLQEFVKKKSLPHLIFTGPAGTGKTSAALALIYDLLGTQTIPQDVLLERNASDECRMQDLPTIKNFTTHIGITENCNFKFVVLDEADNLSSEVQSAFRRIIETAPANVKFIFMCNYIEHIIDPLISRCAIFRFYPLPRIHFEKQIQYIAQKEGITVNKEILNAIFYISQGDMRLAINLFQMAVALLEDEMGTVQSQQLNADTIYEISGFVPQSVLIKLIDKIQTGNLKELHTMMAEFKGISSRGLFRQLMTEFIQLKFPYPKREAIISTLAEYDYRLTLEADPLIQIDGLFAELIKILN